MPFSPCRIALWVLAVGLALPAPSIVRADEPQDAARAVQGKWLRRQRTPNGVVTFIKEHRGKNTVLAAYDEKNQVLYSHKSEFKIERSGKVHIFTFSNRTVTVGPNAGQVDKAPVSFVFRVVNDRFIEAYGLLEDDPRPPNMIVWERVKDEQKS